MAPFTQHHEAGRISSPPPTPHPVSKSVSSSPLALTGQAPHHTIKRLGPLACAPSMVLRSSTCSPACKVPAASFCPLLTRLHRSGAAASNFRPLLQTIGDAEDPGRGSNLEPYNGANSQLGRRVQYKPNPVYSHILASAPQARPASAQSHTQTNINCHPHRLILFENWKPTHSSADASSRNL
ncbi:hypothetical protein NDU88_006007 [Pleurodeles waltl]|uniref:Uncharacterized protein n=1 Tax=Pleurodeles waltl TaxID=8319 RepID=A0AAV7QMZ7_PLEWA|nr:hypothetical protein NDU88_006007 [Pleurodeles waltl]